MRSVNRSRSPRGVVGIHTTPVVHSLYPDHMLVMGLVLEQSLMVISTTDILLYTKVSLLYNV